jgi:hypothetical protein
MSQIFPGSNNNKTPISLGDIVDFINLNSTRSITKSNVSLRNLFDVMRQESFQPAEGSDFFAPDKFSEMYGMYGIENQAPTIILNGQSSITIIAGQY